MLSLPASTIQGLWQFARYGIVGLFANGLGYGLYLLLTYAGLGHKSAMTTIFVLVVTSGFWGNKRITFRHRGDLAFSYVRYWAVYLACYCINWTVMYTSVDVAGFRHQFVQLALIFIDAPLLFLAQKFWVFSRRP